MRRALPLLLLLTLFPLTTFAQPGKQPLTNADIIEMAKQGVPESTMLLVIQTSSTRFDVSPQGLVILHAAGVPEPVLNQCCMRRSRSRRVRHLLWPRALSR